MGERMAIEMDRFVNHVMTALERGEDTSSSTRTGPLWEALVRASPSVASLSDDEIRSLLADAKGREPIANGPFPAIVHLPDGTEDLGRVVASHISLPDGLRGIGEPKAGAPAAIVELGGVLVLFGADGWELAGWRTPKPRHLARCLCPEVGASEAAP